MYEYEVRATTLERGIYASYDLSVSRVYRVLHLPLSRASSGRDGKVASLNARVCVRNYSTFKLFILRRSHGNKNKYKYR